MSTGGNARTTNGDGSERQLQWPFVGIVVLLVALIILTPNLFSAGSAGLQTRAQLIVERASPHDNTSFYVESIGTSTLYQSIAVGFAAMPNWPYKGTAVDLGNWTWQKGNETLALVASSALNPVAVNVTVTYLASSSGVTTEYVGVYAFYLNDTTASLEGISLLSGVAAPPASTPLADLPIFLTLAIETPTGPTQ
jgi:hypothetical protein